MAIPKYKMCTGCKVEKPSSAFTLRKDSRGEFTRLQSRCKPCRQDAQNAWRRSAPEVIKANRQKHRIHKAKQVAAWSKNNRSKRYASHKKWRSKNQQYFADFEARRRTQKKGFEPYSRRFVFERDECVCAICHEPIDWNLSGWDEAGFTVDHVTPLSKGGTDTLDNVRSAHRKCNTRRGNRIGNGVLVVKRRELQNVS